MTQVTHTDVCECIILVRNSWPNLPLQLLTKKVQSKNQILSQKGRWEPHTITNVWSMISNIITHMMTLTKWLVTPGSRLGSSTLSYRSHFSVIPTEVLSSTVDMTSCLVTVTGDGVCYAHLSHWGAVTVTSVHYPCYNHAANNGTLTGNWAHLMIIQCISYSIYTAGPRA